MAMTPFPLPRETRETAILVGNGTVGPYGPTAFKVFDVVDVQVWRRDTLTQPGFVAVAATVTKTSGLALDTVSVTFAAAQAPTTQFVISSARVHERSVAVTKAGTLDTVQLEKELSKQGSVVEELRRDQNRAMVADFGQTIPRLGAIAEGEVWIQGPDNTVIGGPNVAEILEAAEDAAASAVKASEWADKPTDVPVEDGRFSARHYADKAALVNGNIAAALDALQNFSYLADWGLITEAPGEVHDYGSITL